MNNGLRTRRLTSCSAYTISFNLYKVCFKKILIF